MTNVRRIVLRTVTTPRFSAKEKLGENVQDQLIAFQKVKNVCIGMSIPKEENFLAKKYHFKKCSENIF